MKVKKIRNKDNQQPRLLTLNNAEQGSTTIPRGSTGVTNTGKRAMYLKLSVIYKITNLKNNKIYIGSSRNFYERFYDHNSKLRKNKHKNIFLQRAYNKYRACNFEFDIIEEVENVKDLLDREQFYLDLYKPFDPNIGYNICQKACRNRFGTKLSVATKLKIGISSKGRKFSKETIDRRRKIATENQGKTILVYDKDCNLIHEFPSVSETARKMNVSIACISRQATRYKNITPIEQKNKKTHLGNIMAHRPIYYFRYKDIV